MYNVERNGVNILKDMLVELKIRYSNHKLLIAGDLNARIGNLQDFVDNNVKHMPSMD